MSTTTHGPFATFQNLMIDAMQRASYVEPAFHAALEEQIYMQMASHGNHQPEDILDALAKQCGLVIEVDYGFGKPTTWAYQLTEANVHGEQFEQAVPA